MTLFQTWSWRQLCRLMILEHPAGQTPAAPKLSRTLDFLVPKFPPWETEYQEVIFGPVWPLS